MQRFNWTEKKRERKKGRIVNGRCRRMVSAGMLAVALTAGLWLLGSSVAGAVRLGDWSDAMRQWEVCQYLKAKVNPWEVALRVLHDTFGPVDGPNRLRMKDCRIYSVNSANWRGDPGILPGHPPPEATYPPSSAAWLAPTFGMLPKAALLPVYTGFNLLCLLAVAMALTHWYQRETGTGPGTALATVAAVCCLWPPVRFGILCGQPVLFVLFCAWMAMRKMGERPFFAGLCFMGALVKPSCALLFALIPLVRWQWKPLWTTLGAGVVLFVLPCIWLGEWPWTVLAQWTGLCRYLLQGSFTLQEFINALGWDNTPMGWMVVMAVWGGTASWCILFRNARRERLFALLCLANLAWTYHERYDFSLLAMPLVLFAADVRTGQNRMRGIIGLVLCGILGVALTDAVYVPDSAWVQALRWAGRLALGGLWIVTAAAVKTSAANATLAKNPAAQASP